MSDERAPGERVTTVIVDTQEVFRRGLRALLEETGEFEVVGEGGSLAEARLLSERWPDLAALELHLPDGDGVQVVRECTAAGSPTTCVLLSERPCERVVLSAAMAGAAGVIDKTDDAEAILESLRKIVDEGQLLDEHAIEELLEELRSNPDVSRDRTLAHLTPQEARVFELVGQGLTNRQVGDHLRLTEKTVKNYVSRVLAKLGMHHRTEIAMLAGRLTAHDELEAASN